MIRPVLRQSLAALCLVSVLWTAPPAAAHGAAGSEQHHKPSSTLAVTGAVERPLALSVRDLRQMTSASLGDTDVQCASGEVLERGITYRGVLLRDVLKRAGLQMPGHSDKNRLIVIASATDGYKVVFGWHELFNSTTGDAVLVFIDKNGQPLNEREGHISLISGKDQVTGPRKVRSLQSLEVRLL